MTMQKFFALNSSNTSSMAQACSNSVFSCAACAVCAFVNMLFVMDAAILAASISIISIIIIAIIIMAIIRRTLTAQCVEHRSVCTA